MTPEAATLHALSVLNQVGMPYMVVGSLSSNEHGIPRSTKDADIVIEHTADRFRQLIQALEPEIRVDRQISFESVTGTKRNIATVRDTGFQIEFFRLSEDEHDQERFRRRLNVDYFGMAVWMQTAEDVVITKLRWVLKADRPRDRGDVRDVISTSSPIMDWPYVFRWTEQHGTRQLLEEIIATIPPDLLENPE